MGGRITIAAYNVVHCLLSQVLFKFVHDYTGFSWFCPAIQNVLASWFSLSSSRYTYQLCLLLWFVGLVHRNRAGPNICRPLCWLDWPSRPLQRWYNERSVDGNLLDQSCPVLGWSKLQPVFQWNQPAVSLLQELALALVPPLPMLDNVLVIANWHIPFVGYEARLRPQESARCHWLDLPCFLASSFALKWHWCCLCPCCDLLALPLKIILGPVVICANLLWSSYDKNV